MESPVQSDLSGGAIQGARRRRTSALVVAVVAMLASLIPVAAAAESTSLQAGVATENPVLVESGPLVGTNGIFFDADNNLWVASVFGGKISKVDPETGEILEQLGGESGVFFPDDLTIGPDGTLYWTDIVLSAVNKRTPAGETIPLVAPGGLQSANPITISEDGTRLFAAGCYNESLDLVEIDPVNGGIVNTIIAGHPGCASNAMDFVDGAIWSPRPFENRVVRVDASTGAETNVTVEWSVPIAVKFNGAGELHAASQGTGEVIRIDVDNPDPTANREVLATFPIGWIDNIAFDENDRLYVSSASDGAIVEIEANGDIRTVVPGTFTLPLGLAVIGDDIFSGNGQQLLRFDKRTGETVEIFRSVAGVGPLPFFLGMSAWGDLVVGVDAFFGQVSLVDPHTNSVVGSTAMTAPGDALGFDGDLLVSDFGTGEVVRLDGADLENKETIATLPVPLGLAGDDENAYVASFALGQVLQIIEDGDVLAEPRVVASDLAGPEGLTLHDHGRSLLVIEGASATLTQIDLATGQQSTVATGFDFQPANPVFPFAYFNDVVSDGEAIFVAADGSNVIHRFETCAGMTEAQAVAAGYTVDDRSGSESGQVIRGTAGADWIIGSEKRDVIRSRRGRDAVCSRGGRDIVIGGSGADYLDSGAGPDFVKGGWGPDVIHAGPGNDKVHGGGGADVIDAGPGNDKVRAGSGDDTITGGPGSDVLGGGLGADICTDLSAEDRKRSCRRP
ncbi:MAG: hypothetical protein ACR2P0_09335 [Acidimicrobiales bacterium]